MLPPKRIAVVAVAAFALLGALAAAGCSGGTSEASATADVVSAISVIDNAGLHEIDQAVKNNEPIPGDSKTVAEKLHAVTLLTDWPKDLDAQAKAFAAILGEMAAKAEDPNRATAAAAITKAHDAWHEFSYDVWQHLYEEAGIKGDSSHGH